MPFAWPGYYHSLGCTRIQLHSPNVTPVTNLAKVTDQELCYCNSNAWGWHNSHQSRVISITNQLYFPEWKKPPKCTEGTTTISKHCPVHSWKNTNQFTPTTIHHNVLWSIWQKLCQYRQHRSSNTHRAEPVENALMVNPIKGCTDINLQYPSLLSTLQCNLQCMGHAQKCITGTQTFPISKPSGWKHNIAFHKSSKTNRHQTLKHLRQCWCYGNRSEIGNRGGRQHTQYTIRRQHTQ